MRNQNGFTLIELVVVIVILGVLSAVAVPKFINLNEDAHTASVEGAKAAVASGVAMSHAKWLVGGSVGGAVLVDLDGDGTGDIAMNASGWPMGSDASDATNALSAVDCVQTWDALMAAGAPSALTTSAGDYQVTLNGTTGCTYTYQKGTGSRTIGLETTTGAVTVTTP